MYHFRSEAFHHQDTKAQRILGDLVSWWWIQKRRFSSLTGIIQAGLNVLQAFPSRQLGIRQTREMVEGGEALTPILPSIAANTDLEIMPGKKLKELSEDSFAGIHGCAPKCRRIPSTSIPIEKRIFCQRACEINNTIDAGSNFTRQ
jgi:hypothetical protein